jgi:hypothetical protein
VLQQSAFSLREILQTQDFPTDGLLKVRISYSKTEVSITHEPYQQKQIHSLRIVESDTIDYSQKWENRSEIEKPKRGIIRHLDRQTKPGDRFFLCQSSLVGWSSLDNPNVIPVERGDETIFIRYRSYSGKKGESQRSEIIFQSEADQCHGGHEWSGN